MSDAGEIVGMVDVLKLTYATLDQVNSMSTSEGEGPAWNKFWMSMDNETESMMSGEGGSSRPPRTPDTRSLMSPDLIRPGMERGDSVLPNESASHHGADSPDHSALAGAQSPLFAEQPFPFKFKAPSGRVHRIQIIPSAGMTELISSVAEKLGGEIDAVGGMPTFEDGKLGKAGFALDYLDNEGDTVSITTDKDLTDAIDMARASNRDKVDLFVHDPDKAPLPPTTEPQPVIATPAESEIRQRRRFDEDEEEEEELTDRRRKRDYSAPQPQEPLIAGVPNELLLPGAIVTLAVVIVGVFAISRATSR